MKRCTIRDNSDGMAYLKAEYDTADTIDAAIEKLAKYEDAEESGSWVKLPAPIGTTVYCPLMDCDLTGDDDCDKFDDIDCISCEHFIPKIITAPLAYYMLNDDGSLCQSYYLDKEKAENKFEEIKKNHGSRIL